MFRTLCSALLLLSLALAVTGCAAVAVVDAAATVAATGVKLTAKAAGAAVDAVIPEGKKDGS